MGNANLESAAQESVQPLAQKLREGLLHHQRGDLGKAEASFRLALQEHPRDADAFNLLAMVLAAQKKFGEAARLLQEAIALRPSDPVLLGNLGGLLTEANDPLSALAPLREAIRLKPDHLDAIVSLGMAYQLAGRLNEARKQFDRALRRDPTHRRALLGLAMLDQSTGHPKASIENFRRLRKYYPSETAPLVQILYTEKVTPDLPELREAERRLMQTALRDRPALLHALAKAYDDLGRFDEAMARLLEAKSQAASFDIDAHRRDIAAIMTVFTPEFFERRKSWGDASQMPVFIVGMPRSGTSLVEQIIASHPKAFGAGELDDMGFLAATMGMKGVRTDAPVDPQRILSLSEMEMREAAARYLRSLSRRSSNAMRITDKMPHNFERLGLIAMMFPNARIVHCRRDPLDTCLSIFMQDFGQAHAYASDLTSLGHYYSEYAKLMDHWRNVLPVPMLEIDYEMLIENTPAEVRKLISHIGLPWDDACLTFHRTRRSVATSSHWQVRQPIYATSVRRWHKYRQHLQPLMEALGTLAEGAR
jgi:tetratricopeptide (TPR) repeat protein